MWKAPCTRPGNCHAYGADSYLSMLQPTLDGMSFMGFGGRDAEELLYEAAKLHSNREAAAECAAKAQEAIAARDFDKAVRRCPLPLCLRHWLTAMISKHHSASHCHNQR